MARAQRVHQLHQVEAPLALQQAALDQRAEHLGRLLQAVALAPRALEPRARLLQAAARVRAVALLLVVVPLRAEDDPGRGGDREQQQHPRAARRAQPLAVEDLLHAAPRRSRTMRSTKRGSINAGSRSAWRPCNASAGFTSSGLSITSARKPSTLPMSAARRSTSVQRAAEVVGGHAHRGLDERDLVAPAGEGRVAAFRTAAAPAPPRPASAPPSRAARRARARWRSRRRLRVVGRLPRELRQAHARDSARSTFESGRTKSASVGKPRIEPL